MQNARRAHKIRLCGHLRRYKKIVKKTYIIYREISYINKILSLRKDRIYYNIYKDIYVRLSKYQ